MQQELGKYVGISGVPHFVINGRCGLGALRWAAGGFGTYQTAAGSGGMEALPGPVVAAA